MTARVQNRGAWGTPPTTESSAGGGISGRRWSVIFFRRRSKQFSEQRFQGVRPNLVAPQRRMEFVIRVHHSVVQLSFPVREFVVDVEIPDLPTVCNLGHLRVDLVD